MSDEGLLSTTLDEQWLLTSPLAKLQLPDGLGQNVIGCGDTLVGALAYECCRSKDLLAAARLGIGGRSFQFEYFRCSRDQ